MKEWLRPLTRLKDRANRRREMVDEMQHHLELQAEEYRRQGLSPTEARRAAQRDFGSVDRWEEAGADARGGRWLEFFIKDLGLALQSLRRAPGYVLTSVAVLALSIAAHLAITAVADALITRPPTAREPDKLLIIGNKEAHRRLSYPDFEDLRRDTRAAQDIFCYCNTAVFLSGGDDLTHERASLVSGNFFSALGATPKAGRLLADADDQPGAEPVAVVAEPLAARLGLNIDARITLNSRPFRIVGILPASFQTIDRTIKTEVWIPIAQIETILPKTFFQNRNFQWVIVGGRIAPGRTWQEVRSEADHLYAQWKRAFPLYYLADGLETERLSDFRLGLDPTARTMGLLTTFAGLLLVLAFTNYFAMALLRLFSRRRELAIRLALGASRANLGSWLLGEILVVMLLSAGAGWALAHGALFLIAHDPVIGKTMASASVTLDHRVLGWTCGAVLVSGATVWFLLLRQAYRTDLVGALKESSTAPRRQFVIKGLFATQFGLALILLAVAAGYLAAVRHAVNRPYPFRSDNLLLMAVNIRALGFNDTMQLRPFLLSWMERLRSVPGVERVGVSSSAPLERYSTTNVVIEGQDPSLSPDKNLAYRAAISPDYFDAVGARLLRGRDFTSEEVLHNAPVVIVDEALAQRFWPGEDPTGKHLQPWQNSPQPYRVVGVVAAVPRAPDDRAAMGIFLPCGLTTFSTYTMHIVVRENTPALRAALQETIRPLWPYRTPPALRPVEDQFALPYQTLRSAARLVTWLAVIGTSISAIGLYLFSAYTAKLTLKDAAIRLSLGARWFHLLAVHVARYTWPLVFGLCVAGAVVALGPSLLSSYKLEVVPIGGWQFLTAVVLLGMVTAIGLILPLLALVRMDVGRIIGRPE